MGPSKRGHAFSAALLLVTATACGSFGGDGSAPPTPAASEGGAPDGGVGPTDAGGSETGGGGPCGARHDLCHDFAGGMKMGGGWSLDLGGGGGAAEVTTTAALELTATRDGPRLAGALTPPSTGFSCSLRVQPITLVATAGLFATLFEARSIDGSWGVELRLLASGALEAYADGPNSSFQKLSVTGSAPATAWTRIEITVSPDGGGGGRFAIKVGDGLVEPTVINGGVFPKDAYSAVKIGLGLNKSATSAWKIAIDDLICDRQD